MDDLKKAIAAIKALTALIETREGGTQTELDKARTRAQEELDGLKELLGVKRLPMYRPL